MSSLLRAGAPTVERRARRAGRVRSAGAGRSRRRPRSLGTADAARARSSRLAGPFGALARLEADLDAFAGRGCASSRSSTSMPTTACSARSLSALGASRRGASGEHRAGQRRQRRRAPAASCSDAVPAAHRPRPLRLTGRSTQPVARRRRRRPPGRCTTSAPDDSAASRIAAARPHRPRRRARRCATAAAHGEISVVVRDRRRRHAAGRSSTSPAPSRGTRCRNHDVTSVGTDVPRARRRDDQPTRTASSPRMRAAGVTPRRPGACSSGTARAASSRSTPRATPSASGRFHVTHVVTAGSPIGAHRSASCPNRCRCSRWRTRPTSCPQLDGAANPDRPNITTVTRHASSTDSVAGNHDLGRRPTSRSPPTADASHNASVDAFTGSAAGFLDGTSDADPRLPGSPAASEPANACRLVAGRASVCTCRDSCRTCR